MRSRYFYTLNVFSIGLRYFLTTSVLSVRLRYFLTKSVFFLLSIIAFIGCTREWKDAVGAGPQISIAESYQKIAGINVGDEVLIPVTVTSSSGVKRLSYYFIRKTANGTASGTPVNVDRQDLPKDLTHEIAFTIEEDMTELVVVSFNKENFSSEVHITMSEIRQLPVLTFKDGVRYQETVFENKVIKVEGQVTSQSDLEVITVQTAIAGNYSAEAPVAFTNKKNTPFVANVNVVNGLTAIIIKAENVHGGFTTDTFKIGTVAADAVSIALAGGVTQVPVLYVDSLNKVSGNAVSGSDFERLTYAVKKNGVYGPEQPIGLGAPLDEFAFEFSFNGEKGVEAIRISGENAGGKSQVAEFPVGKVYTKLLHFPNIVLTTEIGPGKNNWFAAYQAPHVFDIANAAQNQLMLDFAFIKYTSAANRIVPAAVFNAGTAYTTAMAPYMVGFTKAPYTMVTANRAHITNESYNGVRWDGELTEFLQKSIIAPVNQGGENYNVVTINRRVSGDMVPGQGFVIGWGSWNFANSAVENGAFGLVIVKDYVTANGFATVTLDIKVPVEDNRTKYNPVSIFNYP
jgi:hypothetical protein